jgi:Fibronectin type III domain
LNLLPQPLISLVVLPYINLIITFASLSLSLCLRKCLLLSGSITAPSGYPQNVTVRQFNESSVLVQWTAPLPQQRNGNISAYQVKHWHQPLADALDAGGLTFRQLWLQSSPPELRRSVTPALLFRPDGINANQRASAGLGFPFLALPSIAPLPVLSERWLR